MKLLLALILISSAAFANNNGVTMLVKKDYNKKEKIHIYHYTIENELKHEILRVVIGADCSLEDRAFNFKSYPLSIYPFDTKTYHFDPTGNFGDATKVSSHVDNYTGETHIEISKRIQANSTYAFTLFTKNPSEDLLELYGCLLISGRRALDFEITAVEVEWEDSAKFDREKAKKTCRDEHLLSEKGPSSTDDKACKKIIKSINSSMKKVSHRCIKEKRVSHKIKNLSEFKPYKNLHQKYLEKPSSKLQEKLQKLESKTKTGLNKKLEKSSEKLEKEVQVLKVNKEKFDQECS